MRGPRRIRTRRARQLRGTDNEAEAVLWSNLRARRLNGYKFVRQLPIGPYFADFACRERRLVVEVDGSQHAGQASDRVRDERMKAAGWSVLRVWHVDVLRERDGVLETIVAALDGRLSTTVSSELRFVPAVDETEADD
ncbi:DUF559 domain-containing protein [Aquibium sp. A9E412]|uniref:endonuclease domain-containing protein n=1 Tax=Aquibium sp. A9E412 TaxID=2976767 RepID=UPI0025B1475F|nr:DUF559 domain-containing protein [Aquibium sp. A9E412]MDN2566995.1 DUF559 domain-containing protein [Aquibium sp. A9E412]